jgi:hypothetical protein
MEVYFCHQNQNAKNIGNFTTLWKPHNIGTHLKGIVTIFQMVPLFFKSFHFWVSYNTFWNLLKIPSVLALHVRISSPLKTFPISVGLHACCGVQHCISPKRALSTAYLKCGTKDSDYSISDSPKTVSISLHRYYTLYLHGSLIYLAKNSSPP